MLIILFRLQWENSDCEKSKTHFWSDHNLVLCSDWSTDFHEKWNWDEIPNQKWVVECLDVVKTMLSLARKNSKLIKASSAVEYFDEEFAMYSDIFTKINTKVKLMNEVNLYLVCKFSEGEQTSRVLIDYEWSASVCFKFK